MTVRGLDHVSVACADLDRSLGFYHRLLDIPVRERGELRGGSAARILGVDRLDATFADLDLGDGRTLELLCFAQPEGAPVRPEVFRPGAGHLSLRVDDVDRLCAALQAAGCETASPAPVTITEPGFWHGARVV